MKINRCSVCQNICVPGIDGRCNDCNGDDNVNDEPSCVECGELLSTTEIKNGEDTCYPCQKGNR